MLSAPADAAQETTGPRWEQRQGEEEERFCNRRQVSLCLAAYVAVICYITQLAQRARSPKPEPPAAL